MNFQRNVIEKCVNLRKYPFWSYIIVPMPLKNLCQNKTNIIGKWLVLVLDEIVFPQKTAIKATMQSVTHGNPLF